MTTEHMLGRTVLLTGGTNGIGRVAAERIAERGATLTIVGRDPDKTAGVVSEIQRSSGNDRVDYLLGDLSSLASIRRLAEAFRAQHDSLDVLVNNAGGMFSRRHVTEDGYERTFALNHLAYFLVTRELLPLLQASDAGRIVNVASDAHYRGTIDFDDLMTERRYSPWRAYSQSKLANLLFTFELARRLDGTGITANGLHPGFVRTGFGKSDGALTKALVSIGMLFARSPKKGAETVVFLATAPEVEGVTGQYWMDKTEHRCSREARDADVARRLWEVTERLVDRPASSAA